jgi:hypothetical protein
MTFKTTFNSLKRFLNKDMFFKHGDFELKFTDLSGESFKSHISKIKIAKVDYVEY